MCLLARIRRVSSQSAIKVAPALIIPTLCVGMQPVTLRVTFDAERPLRRYHAERGNDQSSANCPLLLDFSAHKLIRKSYLFLNS
ncbi:hypothetical protein E1508_12995 [Pseudomonas moraviensis]|nr:hypothetical protein E1508_12995 [Pseudomonas moraviensis]